MRNFSGNAILETLLFLPIFLMTLFVGTDIGLSMLDRAIVSDILREGALYQNFDSGEILINDIEKGLVFNEDLEGFVDQIASRLEAVLLERRKNIATESGKYKISVIPVIFEINSENGKVDRFNFSHTKIINEDFSVSNYSNTIVSPEDYITKRIDSADSSFAIYSPSLKKDEKYLDWSMAFLLSVEALSPSLSPAMQETFLNRRTGFQLHELHIVRK